MQTYIVLSWHEECFVLLLTLAQPDQAGRRKCEIWASLLIAVLSLSTVKVVSTTGFLICFPASCFPTELRASWLQHLLDGLTFPNFHNLVYKPLSPAFWLDLELFYTGPMAPDTASTNNKREDLEGGSATLTRDDQARRFQGLDQVLML